ncbi:MAG TPA: hypothetical protein VKB09_11915 [Thermomicrobiales bacterium]|nr:hypothetical protein [Thermomicrobiales bacterium]
MTDVSANGFVDPSYEIAVVDDPVEAIRRAQVEERVIVAQAGQPAVAVIPLVDLQLLLQLEEAELDRIDADDLRKLRESDEYENRVSWEDVKVLSAL